MKGSVHDNMRRYSMPSAGLYDLLTGLLFRGRYREIARAIAADAPAGSEILDVSCGPGTVLVELARIAPALRMTGVDLDAGMIVRAERKARRLPRPGTDGAGRPRFVVADVAALPFADASFDMVVTSYAVHHWPDRHAGLAEIMRVLRPGGRAVVWDIGSPHDDVDEAGHGAPADRAPADGVPAGLGHPNLLGTLRMMLFFRRNPAQRFDFVKPAS